MNLAAAIDEVQVMLSYQQGMSTRIQTSITRAQTHFEHSWPEPTLMPWFLITERAIGYTVAEEERLAIPDDWLADYEEDGLWLTNSDGDEKLLKRYDLQDLRKRWGNSDSAFPKAYGFDGLYYRLFPKPDAIYAARMQYYQADTVLVEGTDTNKWLTYAPEILIGRAGMLLAAAGKNDAVQIAMGRLGDAVKVLNMKTVAMALGNRQFAMGETL